MSKRIDAREIVVERARETDSIVACGKWLARPLDHSQRIKLYRLAGEETKTDD